MTETEVAAEHGLRANRLAKLRVRGDGPRFLKIGASSRRSRGSTARRFGCTHRSPLQTGTRK